LLDFLCELYCDARIHEHQIEFYIYIYSSAKLSKNHEPHTVHLNTLFCYEEWYIFELYVHFVGIKSNCHFDFCISKWEPTFLTKHKYS